MSHPNLSVRAYHRILKLARTIADLVGCDQIQFVHLAEASDGIICNLPSFTTRNRPLEKIQQLCRLQDEGCSDESDQPVRAGI
jgi:hypothetical protein